MSANVAKKERYLLGIVGAFLGAAIGGVVWFVLYQANVVASLSGFLAVLLAIKGYKLFAGKESVKGVVTAVIISAVVIVAAWYLSTASDIYKVAIDEYESGHLGYKPTFIESLSFTHEYFQYEEFARAAFGNLGLGMLFCIIGAFSVAKNAIARINTQKFNETHAAITDETAETVVSTEAAEETAEAVAEPAAETEAPAEETAEETAEAPAEDDGKWVCAKCGAKAEGDICDYCDSPREA